MILPREGGGLQRVAACCSVLQRVVACRSVSQRVAACRSVCCSVLQFVAVCASVRWKCIAVYVAELQCCSAFVTLPQ